MAQDHPESGLRPATSDCSQDHRHFERGSKVSTAFRTTDSPAEYSGCGGFSTRESRPAKTGVAPLFDHIRVRSAGISLAVAAVLTAGAASAPAAADDLNAPLVLTAPKIQAIDENFVSLFSGKVQMTVPALKLGSLSFTPFSFDGPFFANTAIYDENYGRLVVCSNLQTAGVFGKAECEATSTDPAIQAVLGQQRATFTLNTSTGVYTPTALDGSSFADTGDGYCTWTQKDGTKVLFNARHDPSTPLCMGDTVAKIIYPAGETLTYYYNGVAPGVAAIYNPILSIASNKGYLLKYNYPTTPTFGQETSVVAINRAFEACDPAAVSCTLVNSWPTATISMQDISAPDDGFFNSFDLHHHILTITNQQGGNHVFELDSLYRVISYQPPEATAPVYRYTHCSVMRGQDADGAYNTTCTNGPPYGKWNPTSTAPYLRETPQYFFDDVGTVTKNGQIWGYNHDVHDGCQTPPLACQIWTHSVTTPLGKTRGASGNSTPGLEHERGPTEFITNYDGSSVYFEHTVANPPISFTRPLGGGITYSYDEVTTGGRVPRYNLIQTVESPNIGSGTSGTITKTAHFTDGCASIVSCNKPDYVRDANNNQTDYTYDSSHGGVLTATDPAVYSPAVGANVRPQKRYTYVQRYAWYLNASGTMTQDPTPVWLLATESYCRSGAASGSGCAIANDEVLTAYDYGPNSGPNNLMLRGQTVTTGGITHRVCFGHDKVGNKIWEVSANANATSCPAF